MGDRDAEMAANRANWDDRVAIHWASDEYGVAEFIADSDRISGVVERDLPWLGELEGKRVVHLQCHFGKDTLSLARRGAIATGLDFSGEAIAAARRLSDESATPATFVEADVYDAVAALGATFDIVYTGVGALCWLPDVDRWARAVADLLEPGGMLYLREGHPMEWALDDERDDGQLIITYPYFTAEPLVWDEAVSYAGTGTVEHSRTYQWNHGLGEIITAIVEAGLRIDLFREHREMEWQGLPHMELGDDGQYRLPEHQRDLAPLMYTIRAFKE